MCVAIIVAVLSARRWVKRRRACAPADVNAELDSPSRRLFNQLIRPRQHRRRDRQAERFGRLKVYDQLELRRLLHGEIGGLGALEDLVDVRRRTSIEVGVVRPQGGQTASIDPLLL